MILLFFILGTIFLGGIVGLAWLDHLKDRRPYPNWPKLWHAAKRMFVVFPMILLANIPIVMKIGWDLQSLAIWNVVLIILAFAGQVLTYNVWWNKDEKRT